MSRFLLVSALEQELDSVEYHYILYTGVGKINATYKLTHYLSQYSGDTKPDIVINFGTAGSRNIPLYTLVDCTKFVQRDMDVTELGFRKGETAFEDYIPFMLDFSTTNNPIGKNLICGTGDSFVQDIDKEIYSDVFDMESYALAKVCWQQGIDFISYKYITDNADEESANNWKENCSKGVDKFRKILKYYDNN